MLNQNLLQFPELFYKVLKNVDNSAQYFKDYIGLMDSEWIIVSGKNKLYIRPSSVDRWIATENFVLDEYKLSKFKKNDFDTVIDLGANIGASVIALSTKFKKAKFFAIEPNPDNFKQLLKNIKLNKLNKRVKAIQAAVTSKNSEKVKLFLNADYAANSTIMGKGNKIIVNNYKITDLTRLIKGNTLLKMDIEGGEIDFFKKSNLKLLKEFKSIIFEYHDLSEKVNGNVIEKFLLKHGMENYVRDRSFFYIYSV